MRIAAAVLAAGAGSRFEPGPKQLAELGERPLIEHSLVAVRGAEGVDRRLVILGSARERIEAEADLEGFEVVACERWAEGLSASLLAAVDAASECDALLVCLGDQPLIGRAAIERVVAAGRRDGGRRAALRAAYEGRPGHPALIGSGRFDELRAHLTGDTGAGALLRTAESGRVDVTGLGSDADVDTREDLEEMGRRLMLAGTKAPQGAVHGGEDG